MRAGVREGLKEKCRNGEDYAGGDVVNGGMRMDLQNLL